MAAADKDGTNQNPFSFSKFVQSTDYSDNLDIFNNTDSNRLKKIIQNETDFQNGSASPKSSHKHKKLLIVEDDADSFINHNESSSNYHESDSNESESDKDDSNNSSPQSESYLLSTSYTDGVIVKQVENLSSENESLRNELQKTKEEFLQYRLNANKRITNLQKELEKTRLKEADETRALENVVRMVENNLQSTTTRALKAEATVTRLKEEIKFLKEANVPSSQYERLLEEHNCLIETINDRSKSAASLMRSAAEKTQPHIRQLQSGIASLLFLADQFDDISKVTEIPPDNIDTDNSTT